MLDTIAPTIEPIRFSTNAKKLNSFSFKISDNYDIGKGGKSMTYNGYIDGQWVLMTYNGKTETITYRFDEYLPTGEHEFKLVVSDALGNISTFTKTIQS